MTRFNLKSGDQLSPRTIPIWRIVQILVWLAGAFILFNLIFYPTVGIHLFWNVLIPVAPALLVIAVGAWRNICPMASTALFPRHMGLSKRKRLAFAQTGKLNLIAVIALLLIVPLRHAIFDMNGLATAILIVSLVVVAVFAGSLFEWKSAWCSGLCPVHPVEKLYGINNRLSLLNAHCDECHRCVAPCPDTTPSINPLSTKRTNYHRIAGLIMAGGFPGFVWGWFQVPDYPGITGIEQLVFIYKLPILGLLATIVLFLILRALFQERILVSIFSAAAVSCYYWFRIPALFGFGIFPGDGMLIDLTGFLPEWSIRGAICATTLFFFWWIVFSKQTRRSWEVRPALSTETGSDVPLVFRDHVLVP
ncbi:MAG: hypothetical protein QF437_05215 [Planctomycetota bacterium]|jgi:hypothetical protein|nr:hypothetical protein [Planctomycetota bacterium]MDP7129864.1 hypothetical protein [Planctomycetota bacterium]MDP7249584.1 hypothetical protein [Planctomycetota bacterium]